MYFPTDETRLLTSQGRETTWGEYRLILERSFGPDFWLNWAARSNKTEPGVLPDFFSFLHQLGTREIGQGKRDIIALVRIGEVVKALKLSHKGGEFTMPQLEAMVAVTLRISGDFTPEQIVAKLHAYQRVPTTRGAFLGNAGLEFDSSGGHITDHAG
jgi:hypothetical protein